MALFNKKPVGFDTIIGDGSIVSGGNLHVSGVGLIEGNVSCELVTGASLTCAKTSTVVAKVIRVTDITIFGTVEADLIEASGLVSVGEGAVLKAREIIYDRIAINEKAGQVSGQITKRAAE